MRRALFRIFLVLLILIILIAVVVQVVLWTSVPRNLVIAQVEKQLGLRVESRGFVTGWGGSTRLDDVKLSLPLAEESFFDVSSLRVKHTSLIWLILTRHVDVESIELDDPKLVVRQDKNGLWNLQEVLKLVGRTSAGGTPEPGTKTSPPKLPALNIKNASVRIIDKSGKTAQIEPLNITGKPDGPLVYRYEGGVKDHIDVTGNIAPGQQWQHEVKLSIDDIDPWLKDFLANGPTPIHFKANWRGIVDKGKVFGRLNVEESQAGEYSAGGSATIETTGSTSTIRPISLIVTSPNPLASKVELKSGTIQIEGRKITAAGVTISSGGAIAKFDGTGDLTERSASLSAAWQQTLSALKHEGTFKGTLTTLFPARPQIEGTFTTRGDMRANTWDGSMTIAGSGRNWDDIDWTLNVPNASFTRKPTTQASTQPGADLPPLAQIENLTARITTHGNQVTMTDITLPAAERLVGRITVDLAKPHWYVQASGRTKARPRGEEAMFDFDIEAYGNWQDYNLDHLKVAAEGIELAAHGDYKRSREKMMNVDAALTHLPSPDELAKDPTLKGTLIAKGTINGIAYPTDLTFESTVFARNLSFDNRPIGVADIVLEGTATESVQFKSKQFDVFGGHWNLNGQWPGKKQSLHVVVTANDVSLEQVAAAFKIPQTRGVLQGTWNFDFPRLKRDRIEMAGDASAINLSYLGVSDVPIEADQAHAKMSLENGLLRISPIDLVREKGKAQGSLELTLEKAKYPIVTLTANAYPVEIPSSSMLLAVTGDVPRMELDLEKKSAGGAFKAKALVATTQMAMGEASVEGTMHGRLIDIEKLSADAFGGHADGAMRYNVDEPMKMMARLDVTNITGERLAQIFPDRLEGLTGNFSAAFNIEPSVAARAVEPLRMRLIVHPENAKYRSVDIGEMKFSAFLGEDRFVLDKLPSEHDEPWNVINMASGKLSVWARVSQQVDRRMQSHISIRFDELDLDKLVHAADPEAEPMPGKLTGSLTLFGSLRNLDQVIGDGTIELTESDLKNTDVLQTIYNVLNVGTDPRAPIGKGTADVRLESSTLRVEHLRYFNRGVEVRAEPIITNIWDMPDSPLGGYAAGTARPLRDIHLPLLADVDQIMNVIQPTTVELSGTVREPKVRLIPFGEAGESMKRFFLGDVNTEVRKKPE